MLDVEKILCSMVLFWCTTCNERFPTFHPKHTPESASRLQTLATCPIAVNWTSENSPEDARAYTAPLVTGRCARCEADLEKIKNDPLLMGIPLFGGTNNMDPLYGVDGPTETTGIKRRSDYPDAPPHMDPVFVEDLAAIRKELAYCFDEATVTEAMLIAPNHMQVCACYLRSSRGKGRPMPAFRKNCIAFPQEQSELEQLRNFVMGLSVGDVVNVALPEDWYAELDKEVRGVIREINAQGFLVWLDDYEQTKLIKPDCIRRRITLPWRPSDLKENLLIFRRRVGKSDEYVEDLRVRRDLLKRMILLFSRRGHWRAHRGVEPMHAYFGSFTWLSDEDIDAIFPEDGVPADLCYHDLEEAEGDDVVNSEDFVAWLRYGQESLPVARTLMHTWLFTLRGSDNDCLADFYTAILSETNKHFEDRATSLQLNALAHFVKTSCVLQFHANAEDGEDLFNKLVEWIGEEVSTTSAYVATWKSTGTVHAEKDVNVDEHTRLSIASHIFAWPSINPDPVHPRDDARFVKAFPLEFPMGVGDLHQPRPREDFSSAQWLQHLLRYHTGHINSTSRGQRFVYAAFNAVLQDASRKQGLLVHKQVGTETLTKEDLRNLYNTRENLLQTLASFGADLPTTNMHWKRQGSGLEWIVRQMSDYACWVHKDESPEEADWGPLRAPDLPTAPEPSSPRSPDSASRHPSPEPTQDTPPSSRRLHRRSSLREPASESKSSRPKPSPRDVWSEDYPYKIADKLGYGRIPAFWFTLNLPYNLLYEIHRFHKAVSECSGRSSNAPSVDHLDPKSSDAQSARCEWVLDNPDIVSFMHALRIELIVERIVANVVPKEEGVPFQYWLRFEFGSGGNPHVHGQAWTKGNPDIECIVKDDETRRKLRSQGHPESDHMQTREEAELAVSKYFEHFVKEMHPCKDSSGNARYPYITDLLAHEYGTRPQCVPLIDVLERAFADPLSPDLSELKQILVAIIESGQRHTGHGHDAPKLGLHPCARKIRMPGEHSKIACRYDFPKALFSPTAECPGRIADDPHRPELRTLQFERNDTLLNSFEPHLLLMNRGNIDWRPLLNLWCVLEYLTKYNAKSGKTSKQMGQLFEETLQAVHDFEDEDGLHCLWRRTIMKFYSRILGDRDYSLFEVFHFGLRLPGVLTTFGNVESFSMSNWTAVQPHVKLGGAEDADRATYLSKLEKFNRRCSLKRGSQIMDRHLEGLSAYAFARMYYFEGTRVIRRRKEAIISLTGVGWPPHAQRSHKAHVEYARRTLYAYMPCPGPSGTEYIDEACVRHYRGCWTSFLYDFCVHPRNLWCPPWIRRNYQMRNKTERDWEEQWQPRAAKDGEAFPHEELFSQRFEFEVDAAGEPEASDEELQEQTTSAPPLPLHWRRENQEPWQQHSQAGPNVHPQERTQTAQVLEAIINPDDFAWADPSFSRFDLIEAQGFWNRLADQQAADALPSHSRTTLNDDFQQLFVDLVVRQTQHIRECVKKSLEPTPMRLLLLGTAGSGKTRALQTALSEIQRLLPDNYMSFVRVAAPTGSAAFNIHFGASTIHRLIKWTTPPYFDSLKPRSEALAFLQTALKDAHFFFIDEISMVGRQMMGRVDSRLRQAFAGRDPTCELLGGSSLVAVGDPAQCEAITDQQIFDVQSHRETASHSQAARLSNAGREVYASFTHVVVLDKCHRLSVIDEPRTEEDHRYNADALRFVQVLRRLRDLETTLEDYYWLCARKRSRLSFADRAGFSSAPVIMDFRRVTELNPEKNCDHYNTMKQRSFARVQQTPIARFEALHEGISHKEGMALEDQLFNNLAATMEITKGAPVILIHNINVSFGLINGTRGTVAAVLYVGGGNPSHPELRQRMPTALIIDFPAYEGPPFFDSQHPERKTWLPLLPATRRLERKSAITRTQFPIVLGWALTIHKAQGMTLDRCVVRLGSRAPQPGTAFTALSRTRHPDHLMLDDEFPSLASLLVARTKAAFKQRQRWEKEMRARFSATIRECMRDPALYSPESTWSVEDAALAEEILAWLPSHKACASSDLLPQLLVDFDKHSPHDIEHVWRRLQEYPHMYSVAACLSTLDDYNLSGVRLEEKSQPTVTLTYLKWRFSTEDLEEFQALGALSKPLMYVFALLARPHLPAGSEILNPYHVCAAKMGPCTTATETHDTLIPFQSRSGLWCIYTIEHARGQITPVRHNSADAQAFQNTDQFLATHYKSFVLSEPVLVDAANDVDLVLLGKAVSILTHTLVPDEPAAAQSLHAAAKTLCKHLLQEATF